MQKKIVIVTIFMIILSSFISIFSDECVAPPPVGAPTNFTATAISKTRIDLSWTMGQNADITLIERNTTSSWSRGNGTSIFFTVGTSFSDTELSEGTHYYYQAWSCNLEEEWSDFVSIDNTTFANQPPIFESPVPSNGSISNPFSLSWSIPINDSDGDAFSWTLQCNNGQFTSGSGEANGTKSLELSGLGYSTTYKVWVNATDPTGSNLYTKKWYSFTTNQQPLFGSPTPANGSISNPLSLSWSIPINDPDGDTFNWTIQCNNGQYASGIGETNGTKSLPLTSLGYSTTYTVWVNATDPTPAGTGQYTRRWYTFTTEHVNNPPIFGTPFPGNNSTGNPLSLTWNIPINDSDGDAFSWTIQCNNGQFTSGSGEANGTKSLALSGLEYSTAYTVGVNATDPTGSGLSTRKWYTFTTNQQPIFGSPTPSNGSTNNPLNPTWSIQINDPEGNTFNWTIQCSNQQVNNGTNDANGTKSLALSGLAYSKTYKVWVNATDPTGSRLYTQRWYTFTTKGSGGGGDGEEPPVVPVNKKPIANTSAGEPYLGYIYSEITFDGSRSSDPDGNITKWLWVFGDNTNGAGMIIRHTYSKAGTYNVTLTVTDNKGDKNSDTTTCMILQIKNTPLTQPVITGPSNCKKNTMYTFTALSTDQDNDPIMYTFNWGVNMSVDQSSGFLPNGSSFTVSHNWTTAGRYRITVTVTDDDNHTEFSKFTVYVDALQTADLGYLLDDDGDGIYDTFHSDVLNRITHVDHDTKGVYAIDSDGNGEWDYTFDKTNGLVAYQPPRKTPGFELVLILCAIAVILFWKRKQ